MPALGSGPWPSSLRKQNGSKNGSMGGGAHVTQAETAEKTRMPKTAAGGTLECGYHSQSLAAPWRQALGLLHQRTPSTWHRVWHKAGTVQTSAEWTMEGQKKPMNKQMDNRSPGPHQRAVEGEADPTLVEQEATEGGDGGVTILKPWTVPGRWGLEEEPHRKTRGNCSQAGLFSP